MLRRCPLLRFLWFEAEVCYQRLCNELARWHMRHAERCRRLCMPPNPPRHTQLDDFLFLRFGCYHWLMFWHDLMYITSLHYCMMHRAVKG